MSDQKSNPQTYEKSRTPRSLVIWGVLFALLTACRLMLPMHETDTMMVHRAIVDSLLNAHNWGRQAMVGALEYPLLPTLGLLCTRTLVGARHAGILLVAASQAWAFCYLLRLRPSRPRRLVLAGLALLFAGALPDMRAAVLALDPNWIAAVPFCSAFYHLVRWFRGRQLRDAVLAAVNGGLLVFCGVVGVAAGMAIVIVLTHDVRRIGTEEAEDMRGVPLVVWAPLVYCLLLWLLWNWLVLGDLFFTLRPLFAALADTPGIAVPVRAFWATVYGPVSLWACCALAATGLWSGRKREVSAVFAAAAAVVLARALCLALGMFSGAGTLLATTAALLALGLATPLQDRSVSLRQKRLRRSLGCVAALLLVLDMILLKVPDPVDEGVFAMGAPLPETVTSLIDRHWPRSRTAVYGVRLPALYHDPYEQRFVARMDYHESLFLEQAKDEVMHLLVPPPDGRFYAPGHSVFAEIHRQGRPHLLLEKQWRNGWQLWRCVIFPDDESRLRHLE